MLHVYHGDGKGKTTAAVGLAVRALAFGTPVRFVQFLKDGSSSEVAALRGLGAECLDDGPLAKFTFRMTDEEREASRELHDDRLAQVGFAWATESEDGNAADGLVVLDECLGALAAGLVDEDVLRELCRSASGSHARELVLTGRPAPEWLLSLADYDTEMRCGRHPFERGVCARGGIEY